MVILNFSRLTVNFSILNQECWASGICKKSELFAAGTLPSNSEPFTLLGITTVLYRILYFYRSRFLNCKNFFSSLYFSICECFHILEMLSFWELTSHFRIKLIFIGLITLTGICLNTVKKQYKVNCPKQRFLYSLCRRILPSFSLTFQNIYNVCIDTSHIDYGIDLFLK